MFKLKAYLFLPFLLVLFNGCGSDILKSNRDAENSLATEVNEIDLGGDHNGVFKTSTESAVVPLYFNRHLTFNLLRDLFGPSMQGSLVNDIGWRSEEFGANFGLYQTINLSVTDCNAKKNTLYRCRNAVTDLATRPTVGVSSPREALRMTACQRAVENPKAVAYLYNKIEKDSTIESPPKAVMKNYERLYQLFFRGRPVPPVATLDSFDLVVKKESDLNAGWNNLILSVCLSPHWQVL